MSEEQGTPPPVNEIVNLLSRFAPATLEELRRDYPAQQELLRIGITAGARKEDPELRVRTAVAIKGLGEAVKICERELPRIQGKLEVSRKWILYGHIFAVVGGASIFGTISQTSLIGSYVAATITLLGSLASTYGQYLSEAVLGRSGKITDNYRVLVEALAQARQTLSTLRELVKAEIASKYVAELVRDANVLSLKIMTTAGA